MKSQSLGTNVLFYAVTEAEIRHPESCRAAMKKIRAVGFDAVGLEFRNVKAPRESQRFQDRLEAIIREVRAAGLKLSLEVSANNLDTVLRAEVPEAFTDSLRCFRLPVCAGRVVLELPGDLSTWEWVGAYTAEESAHGLRVGESLVWPEPCVIIAEGGGCAMTRESKRAQLRLEWTVETDANLVLLAVRQRHALSFKDMGHPELIRRFRDFVRQRSRLEPDEFFWDEPSFGFAFFEGDGRAINNRLLEAFRSQAGYDLFERWPDLWFDRDAESARVRLDYAEVLESSLEVVEVALQETIGERAKPIVLGGHRTMHEELSDDCVIGCADYFRHDRCTTHAYTDSVFEREDSMMTMAHLARSMALSGSESGREAWNMSWGFHPTPQRQAFFLRMLGAMGVRWIAHVWNDSMQFGPGFPHHPCWEGMAGDLAAHRELLAQTEGATPWGDTLVIYDWRAPLAVAGPHRHTHRRSLLFLGKSLTLANQQFFIAEPSGLTEFWQSRLLDGSIRRIFFPWPVFLDAKIWDTLKIWVEQGGELILFGPLPRVPKNLNSSASALLPQIDTSAQAGLMPGDQIELDGLHFSMEPDRIQQEWDDAPANTLPPSYPVAILLPNENDVICGQDSAGRAVALRSKTGEGCVLAATVELPFFPDALPTLFGWKPFEGAPLEFVYERDGQCFAVEVPFTL